MGFAFSGINDAIHRMNELHNAQNSLAIIENWIINLNFRKLDKFNLN